MRKFTKNKTYTEQFIRWGESYWWMLGRYKIIPRFIVTETNKNKRITDNKQNLLDLGSETRGMMR